MSYRPPIGFPQQTTKRARWQGWLVSLLAHSLFVLLLVLPALRGADLPRALGAGGPGPAGGGGGARGVDDPGRGERLQFVRMMPSPAPSRTPLAPPQLVVPKPLRPVVTAPVPVSAPAVPVATSANSTNASGSASSAGGTGAGEGGGTGPGRGGGIGSGEGTGRGSSTGPGTGGGPGTTHPPTPTQFYLPPLPAPAKVRGFRLIAWFDVDSTGKSTLMRFTPSPDRAYNDRLRETLRALKFRPAVRPDGAPVRDTVDVQFIF